MSTVEIPVQGMCCERCERPVQAALTHVEGVLDANADHRAARVRVSFDSDRVDERRLRQAIEAAGFQPAAQELGASRKDCAEVQRQ